MLLAEARRRLGGSRTSSSRRYFSYPTLAALKDSALSTAALPGPHLGKGGVARSGSPCAALVFWRGPIGTVYNQWMRSLSELPLHTIACPGVRTSPETFGKDQWLWRRSCVHRQLGNKGVLPVSSISFTLTGAPLSCEDQMSKPVVEPMFIFMPGLVPCSVNVWTLR